VSAIPVDEETRLRPLVPGDAQALFAQVDANRAHLRRWLPWLDANRTLPHTREFIRRSLEREREGLGRVFLIEHANELCGTAGYNWIDPANRACEIGYWLREDHQGRGIATRCVGALVRHAFEGLELNRVNIQVAVENARSRAIPERLGFQRDGVVRDAEWLYDHFVDAVLYTLLRREFRDRQRRQSG